MNDLTRDFKPEELPFTIEPPVNDAGLAALSEIALAVGMLTAVMEWGKQHGTDNYLLPESLLLKLIEHLTMATTNLNATMNIRVTRAL